MHSNAFQNFFFLQPKPVIKLYGAHIRSNDTLLNSLGGGSLWATVKFSRQMGLPSRLPSSAHICDVPLPSVPLRVSVCLLAPLPPVNLSAVCDDPEAQRGEHTVASQATVRRAIAFTYRSYNMHQHSLTIIPFPETVWHSLVLLSALQYLNILVG